MTKFIAIKINYDHRQSIAPHLKYSTLPTLEEYNEYLEQYQDEGVGGSGFHECLNFAISETEPVRLYLPPTCHPSRKNAKEEFVIFSFTYKGDKELSANIIGVHAGVKILSIEPHGIERREDQRIEGVESLNYHAEAPPDLVTLFTPPLAYDNSQGTYTPRYKNWGYGLRYIEDKHACNIVTASLKEAKNALRISSISQSAVIQRQIDVLQRIERRYFLDVTSEKPNKKKLKPLHTPGPPDKEIGYLGEKCIYERELDYVKSMGREANEVEWVSQSVPTSPFDIRTIRPSRHGVRDHFIEVKSSTSEDVNVYVSSGQIDFFKANEDCSTFAFVSFDELRKSVGIRDLTLGQLIAEFDLVPIKFKLTSHAQQGV